MPEAPDESSNKPLEYTLPGGASAPVKLTPDSIPIIAHVIGSTIVPVAQLATELAEGGTEIDDAFMRDVQSARDKLLGTAERKGAIDFLLDRYEEDMKVFHGLAQCLLNLKRALQNSQWERAVQEFRAAKARFRF